MMTTRRQGAHASAIYSNTDEALWFGVLTALTTTGLAFALYVYTAAPDLTWGHQGADGGDFLAAAVTNGVPHPSGYPLYTVLLQLWLLAGEVVAPGASPARLGNMLSAMAAAACAGVTVMLVAHLTLPVLRSRLRWLLAGVTGLLWAVSPLMWGQALITEVYAMHMLLVTALLWLIITRPERLIAAAVVCGLGLANHLTFALLLPAVALYLWQTQPVTIMSRRGMAALSAGTVVCVIAYLRIPLAAGSQPLSPVNWGYADNWEGFWWLVSGSAYRAYFAEQSFSETGLRIAAWARSLVTQFTPAGLLVAAIGLTYWDREWPRLRTFSLLWMLPVSVYAILYTTRDSLVYLLPALWMLALWLGAGLAVSATWLGQRVGRTPAWATVWLSAFALVVVLMLVMVRTPTQSLRHDDEAMAWLEAVTEAIEPGAIVVSSSDAQTFALWYGAWATGDLLAAAPGTVVVNDSLYQFEWYRRLMGDVYPDVAGVGEGLGELLNRNASLRPIYFVEPLDGLPAHQQQNEGPVWRYAP